MVVCPNGSAPQSGVPAEVIIDNAFMASLLPAGLEWLAQFLPYIPPLVFSTALFCADDPPDYPDMSLVEWAALVAGSPAQAAQESGRQVAQALYNILWYRLCECLIDATPPIGSPPAEPSDLPALNPPDLVNRPVVEPCGGQAIAQFTRSAGGGPTFAGFVTGSPVGKNWTLGRLTIVITASTGNFNVTVEVRQQTANSSATGTIYSFNCGVGTTTRDIKCDPSFPSWAIYLTGQAGTGNRLVDVNAVMYCDGEVPGGTVGPCCPPDETQVGMLMQILRSVTLIQRQAAPFSYVYGANHVDLVGDDEFEVSGLIGVSVDVTTLPARAGRAVGTPETIFDVGFVSLGTADGWEHSRRIDHDGTLLLPSGAGAFTRVGYTLAPDVVVAIRELVREP